MDQIKFEQYLKGQLEEKLELQIKLRRIEYQNPLCFFKTEEWREVQSDINRLDVIIADAVARNFVTVLVNPRI